MEVNLEDLFVAIGYTPSPPPTLTSKTPNIIVTECFFFFHSKNIVTVKFRTPGHELHLRIFSSMC